MKLKVLAYSLIFILCAGAAFAETAPTNASQENQLKQGIQIAATQKNYTVLAKAYYDLGNFYLTENRRDKAQATLSEGLAVSKKFLPANHPLIGFLSVKLSTVYMFEQNFNPALKYLNEGIAILEQRPELKPAVEKLKLVGDLLSSFNTGLKAINDYEYEKAEQTFRQALNGAQQLQEPNIHAISLASIGLAQLMQDKLSEAATSLSEAEALAKSKGVPEAYFLTLVCYESLYARKGDIAESKKYALMSLQAGNTVFQHLGIDKALFEQEVERLNLIEAEVNKTVASAEASDYMKDALLTRKIFHWNEKNGVIKVYLASDTKFPGWRDDFVTSFKSACQVWQEILGNRVRFEFTENPADKVDVKVSWYNQYKVKTGLTRLAHISDKIASASIDFNLKTFDNKIYDPATVYRVSLHEVGHLLGIVGHSKNPSDIMFPTITSAKKLSERDIATLLKLYNQKPEITNPESMTLSDYQGSDEFQRLKNAINQLDHF